VTVSNVAPTLGVSGNQQVTAGVPLSLVNIGVFTDPAFANPSNTGGQVAETFTYSINWGTARRPLLSGDDRPGGVPGVLTVAPLTASHSYQQAGSFVVTVRVSDDDGGIDEQQFDVGGGYGCARRAGGRRGCSRAQPGLRNRPTSEMLGPATPANGVAAAEEPANEPPVLFGPGDLTIGEGQFT